MRFISRNTQTGPFHDSSQTGVHTQWLYIETYTVRADMIATAGFDYNFLGKTLYLGVIDLG